MKVRSFRLRIAVLSTVLAGSALVGFSLVAWRLIYVEKVSRLDAKLEYLVKRTVRPRSPEWWQPFVTSLPGELGIQADTPILVLSVNARGQTLYQDQDRTAPLTLQDFLLPIQPFSPIDSKILPPAQQPGTKPGLTGTIPDPRIKTHQTKTGAWRIGAVSSTHAQGAIAVSLHAIDQEMATIQQIFLIAIPGTVLLIAGGAWIISGRVLYSVQKLTQAIQQVSSKGLHQQVPVNSVDVEFTELVQVFNQMLDRLDRSFKQASRFSGDAAHELKTPLAILQGDLERAIHHAEPGSTLQQTLRQLLDEVSRLSHIVRKLLLLSRVDAGKIQLYLRQIYLGKILSLLIEDLELLAPDLVIETYIDPELQVLGDPDLLMQSLQNLISNAVKYNQPEGWVRIRGQQHPHFIALTVSNPTQEPLERDRVFDRFYRGDPARTRKIEGLGLGLSIAREIARVHGGDITLDAAPAGQVSFTLTLPTLLPDDKSTRN